MWNADVLHRTTVIKMTATATMKDQYIKTFYNSNSDGTGKSNGITYFRGDIIWQLLLHLLHPQVDQHLIEVQRSPKEQYTSTATQIKSKSRFHLIGSYWKSDWDLVIKLTYFAKNDRLSWGTPLSLASFSLSSF